MNIHEYQSKAILRSYGVNVPTGKPAFSVEEAVENARELGTDTVVVKAQIHAGGRGKAFRVMLIGLGVVFAQWLIMICGAYSALLGSQGLISGYIRRKKDEHDGEE